MVDWLDSVAGPDYARAVLWTIAALIVLVIVLVIVKLIRGMTFGTFVAGGRNRKTRLAVMDATPVDSHRRLVLVRRDDIEHLLLIGGPTDVVVERDIRLAAPRRPVLTGGGSPHPTPQQPARQPQPAVRHVEQPARSGDSGQMPAAPKLAPVPAKPAPAPVPTAAPPPVPHNEQPAARQPSVQDSAIDDDVFMEELEMSLDDLSPQPSPAASYPSAPRAPASLDDEMTKLLSELSSRRK